MVVVGMMVTVTDEGRKVLESEGEKLHGEGPYEIKRVLGRCQCGPVEAKLTEVTHEEKCDLWYSLDDGESSPLSVPAKYVKFV